MKFFSAILLVGPRSEVVDPLTDPSKQYNSPGVVGFIAVFLMMLAATLLILDMVRRVRRVRYRNEVQEKLAREAAVKGRKADK
jgi:C4-dicarboxylate-specific signal transduction histidine kinase